jgi:hypothetical protein
MEPLEPFLSDRWRGKGVPKPEELIAQKHPEEEADPLKEPAPITEKAHVSLYQIKKRKGIEE